MSLQTAIKWPSLLARTLHHHHRTTLLELILLHIHTRTANLTTTPLSGRGVQRSRHLISDYFRCCRWWMFVVLSGGDHWSLSTRWGLWSDGAVWRPNCVYTLCWNRMGCASSGQVASSGKNFIDAAKETANDVATKGEKTIQGESKNVSNNSRLQFIFVNLKVFTDKYLLILFFEGTKNLILKI